MNITLSWLLLKYIFLIQNFVSCDSVLTLLISRRYHICWDNKHFLMGAIRFSDLNWLPAIKMTRWTLAKFQDISKLQFSKWHNCSSFNWTGFILTLWFSFFILKSPGHWILGMEAVLWFGADGLLWFLYSCTMFLIKSFFQGNLV